MRIGERLHLRLRVRETGTGGEAVDGVRPSSRLRSAFSHSAADGATVTGRLRQLGSAPQGARAAPRSARRTSGRSRIRSRSGTSRASSSACVAASAASAIAAKERGVPAWAPRRRSAKRSPSSSASTTLAAPRRRRAVRRGVIVTACRSPSCSTISTSTRPASASRSAPGVTFPLLAPPSPPRGASVPARAARARPASARARRRRRPP